jgi:hypothetical protein
MCGFWPYYSFVGCTVHTPVFLGSLKRKMGSCAPLPPPIIENYDICDRDPNDVTVRNLRGKRKNILILGWNRSGAARVIVGEYSTSELSKLDIQTYLQAVVVGKIPVGEKIQQPHCEKRISFFPSPWGVWLVTSWLGAGKTITFFTV